MAKLALKKGSTDVSVYLFAQDSSKTTGAGLTGLAYNTASLTAYYVRPLGSATQITLATQTVTGAHADGGFVEVDSTNMPGVYRLDLPDAVCASGVPSVVVMLKGAANLAPVLLEIQLTDFDLNDATPNVTVSDIAANAIDAGAVKADAVTKIQNGLATALALDAVDNFIDTEITTIINHLTGIKGVGWTNETLVALKAYVDELETRLTAARAGYLDKLNVPGTLANSNDANTYKANVSGLSTTLHVQEVENKVDAIRDDTNTTGVLLRDDAITAIFDDANVVGSYTFRQVLKILAAALAGKASGGGTTSITFRGMDDASDVIVATVDANGNRSAVTLTV